MFFTEADDPIDIRYDNVFKAVFTKNVPTSQKALSSLVSALIGRKVSIIAINANEPPIENILDRQIRFDISCKAENNELINVEISLNPDHFEPVRLEFHAGKLFTAQDIRGKDKTYNDLKRTYQITILAKKKFFSDEAVLHTFEYYDPERKVSLNGRSRIITLELFKLDKVVEKPVQDITTPELWGIFFQYLTDKEKREKINEIVEQEEGIAMASEVLITISRDEVERARLTSEYKYKLDTQSQLGYAKQEGRVEGITIGITKGKLEIARKLKDRGRPLTEIAEDTGLSPEEIEALNNEQVTANSEQGTAFDHLQ